MVDNCCWYMIRISVSKEYFNGEFEIKTLNGRVSKFIIENDITDAQSLFENTFYVLGKMQVFAKLSPTSSFRRQVYSAMRNYIKFLYINGFCESVYIQSTHSGHLVRFEFNGEFYRMNSESVNFLEFNINDYPKLPEIYSKESVVRECKIKKLLDSSDDWGSVEFRKYVELFSQLNNKYLMRGLDLNIKYN